jgi:transcriptional regulator with XRE-family HTH domain
MTTAEKIKRARLAAGLTQQGLAEKTGTTVRAAQRWEAGAKPRRRMLQRIADATGVQPEDLEGDESPAAEFRSVDRDYLIELVREALLVGLDRRRTRREVAA